MNLLNEEIRAIQLMINHLKMGIPLEADYGKKKKMEESKNELVSLLEKKLKQCEDYKG